MSFDSYSIAKNVALKYIEIYQAKGEAQWTKTTFSYLDYAGWLSEQGKAGTTYTLCARLDNLFRSGYGYTQGAWNSN